MHKETVFKKIYDIVASIPQGKVMTYGQIASLLDERISARIVGFAMNAAPKAAVLPCHRVVNRKGEMAPGIIFGGSAIQRKMLEDEGAPFTSQGNVNLQDALWLEAAKLIEL